LSATFWFSNFSSCAYKCSIFSSWSPLISNFSSRIHNLFLSKKGSSGQPHFGFPIFQDDLQKFHYICHFIFQFFKCARSIIAQGPFICPLQVLDRTLCTHFGSTDALYIDNCRLVVVVVAIMGVCCLLVGCDITVNLPGT
jgi:hypothetical protein